MPVIDINKVSKDFYLGQMTSLGSNIKYLLAKLTGRKHKSRPRFTAIDQLSLSIEEGEVVGIIGSNGAGKSTLLKLISRISMPTKGDIRVSGKIVPLIEVGAGLHPELTGRENIFLNASILGIPRAEIKKKLPEIIDFAEIEDFVDTPIKRYSSGMKVRLGFAIAINIKSDILIVDEVLAVGDLAFQRKCFDKIETMIQEKKKTVLLVSHNVRQVNRLCTRVILMDKGKVIADGNPTDVCNFFYERSDDKIKKNILSNARYYDKTDEIELVKVSMLDNSGMETGISDFMSSPTFNFTFKVNRELAGPVYTFGIHTTDFVYIATETCDRSLMPSKLTPGIHSVKCKLNKSILLPGVYSLRFKVDVGDIGKCVFYAENIFYFTVVKEKCQRSEMESEGFFALEMQWSLSDMSEGEQSQEKMLMD